MKAKRECDDGLQQERPRFSTGCWPLTSAWVRCRWMLAAAAVQRSAQVGLLASFFPPVVCLSAATEDSHAVQDTETENKNI